MRCASGASPEVAVAPAAVPARERVRAVVRARVPVRAAVPVTAPAWATWESVADSARAGPAARDMDVAAAPGTAPAEQAAVRRHPVEAPRGFQAVLPVERPLERQGVRPAAPRTAAGPVRRQA